VVVQGQLAATLLLRRYMAEANCQKVRQFSFRALRPVFAGRPFYLEGRADAGADMLWTRDADGMLAIEASAVSEERDEPL
jgi:3-methylfumaryl-CoA hydratase